MVTKLIQMLKTGLSGVAASAIDFAVLIALVEVVGLPVAIAAFLAAAVGAVVGFCITKTWAFADRAPVDSRQVGAYATVALGNAILVATLLHLLVTGSGVLYPVAKVVASLAAFALWSYPAQARWVFTKGEHYAV